ncbi:MAG: RNA-binding S4 domain-containing protein [Oscillospiraceae bacterium]|nr:RNA-binding S4 domain-containing protein [Oscillospiraceae bacterium]MCL2279682.1 RNA-binding S4 domain-containing protein [Oscillospiraceae bacterium]
MKVKLKGLKKVHIDGEFIKLDSLLKFSAIASTGGEAKYLISSGDVVVDKEVCTQRGRKIRPGSIIEVGENMLLVKAHDKV